MSIRKIDILTHADFHGQFREDNENPGLSRFFCAVESIRQKNSEATLLLDAGDEAKCLWYGRDVYEGLGLLKTDAMVLGNHEFDKGRESLEECIGYGTRHFPMLCANIIYKENGEFIKGIKPFTVIKKAGIDIGILGLSSFYTPHIVNRESFKDFVMTDSVQAIRRYVPLMRKQGAKIIVILTHFPFYPDETGELFEVYEQVKDLCIDVFIGGHIPGDYAKVKDDCAIIKAGFHGVSLGHVSILYDDDKEKIVSRKAEIIDVANTVSDHEEKIDAFVQGVCKDYESYFTEAIGEAKEDIIMHLSKESAMGDLICDALREASGCDFVYANCTSCGRLIPKGIITRYTIQKALAFNENIHVTEMKGSDLYDLFELIHDPEIFGNNAELMFSGLKIKIDHNRSCGHKVAWIKDFNGDDIDKNRIFSVATSAYMADGGNATVPITERCRWKKLDILIHDAIADHIIRNKTLTNRTDDRYEFIGEPENDNSPW